ncbi:unnamed protein product [Tilletia controversa]|uniref:FCP1 homology domain-containing protein n=3 Tax=Tilletia TaxID=13289 RepID=A0A8X7MM93_9BASI|nr:hypothetical protein CF336_g7302 [Tilletia laevis]KAE8193316.1 hypothetical protein CF328_g5084 [Tilletia controversa]KAE8249146.1 hypothetical protein A4X03_0g6660 [Tilletia caries]KAE8189146.1 hypothetical protein CF335_g6699 [Tilletia laevis]KAE8241171.1 hypothetical protein A4X06_0g7638 [Tilletia controversa]
MNSLTLIDSVLTRSFSTSAVPQRRRSASSPSTKDNDNEQQQQQQQQQQRRRQQRQSRKQESEPGPRSRSSPPAHNLDDGDDEEDDDDDDDQQRTRTRRRGDEEIPNPLPESAHDDPLSATAKESADATEEPSTEAAPPITSTANTAPRTIPRGPTPLLRHTPKILVLDLDETLIHSTSRPRPGYELAASKHLAGTARAGALLSGGFGFGWLIGLDGLGALLGLRGRPHSGRLRTHTVEVVLQGRSLMYHVYKRPWVDYFLRKVAAWYHVVVYTASVQEYANPVIDWLDQGRGLISGRLFRDACIFSNGTYLKNLSIVDSDLSRVCLVDNSPASYLINPANGIPIEGWTHDPNDEALLDLLPVLDSLRFAQDVRHILGLRGF